MITTARLRRAPAAAPAALHEAAIALVLGDGRLRLDDGGAARRALSCLVAPEPGDRVLWAAADDGERYVLAVLARPAPAAVRLDAGAADLTLAAPRLALSATESLSLTSLRDAELSAATGRLRLAARDVTLHAVGSLIETARHVVGRCESWLMTAAAVARLHGRHALLTADEDIRADAERISLG